MHAHTVKKDVQLEAEMSAALCHPCLPLLFGICSRVQPYKIVLQFHGFIDTSPLSLTIRREIDQSVLKLQGHEWTRAIAQLLDAVEYLHTEAKILHNDITTKNILLGPSAASGQSPSAVSDKYQILLIDFGKATKCDYGKMLHLTVPEKQED